MKQIINYILRHTLCKLDWHNWKHGFFKFRGVEYDSKRCKWCSKNKIGFANGRYV